MTPDAERLWVRKVSSEVLFSINFTMPGADKIKEHQGALLNSLNLLNQPFKSSLVTCEIMIQIK